MRYSTLSKIGCIQGFSFSSTSPGREPMSRPGGVDPVHVGRIDRDLGDAAPELVELYLLGVVVLGVEAERVCADAEVGVLGDEHRRHLALALADVEGYGEDLVVGAVAVGEILG